MTLEGEVGGGVFVFGVPMEGASVLEWGMWVRRKDGYVLDRDPPLDASDRIPIALRETSDHPSLQLERGFFRLDREEMVNFVVLGGL